jgi:hypothetical protein
MLSFSFHPYRFCRALLHHVLILPDFFLFLFFLTISFRNGLPF